MSHKIYGIQESHTYLSAQQLLHQLAQNYRCGTGRQLQPPGKHLLFLYIRENRGEDRSIV